jgi:poly(hydroxyalkanoate) depolymerase family esterase
MRLNSMNPVFLRLLREARAFARRRSIRHARAALRRAWKEAARQRPWRRRVLQPASFVAAHYSGPEGARDYKLFLPAGDAIIERPLVVMLHGCGQTPDDFAAGTRMNEHAQARGVMVLYPAQAPRSNQQRCWNWFVPADQQRGAGEPALLAAMTRHAMALHPVDPRRVYVAGLSAGGAMADILATEYADLYAAAGVHSGVRRGVAHDAVSAYAAMQGREPGAALHAALGWFFPGVRFAPSGEAKGVSRAAHATPTIVFHGDADETVHPRNGHGVIEALLERAGADVSASTLQMACGGRSVTRSVHRRSGASAREPALAEHWIVHGAGHAWSGGNGDGSYADALGPDASGEMLRFFAEHARASPSAHRITQPTANARGMTDAALAPSR